MANETMLTIIGNLTGDPELRSTGSGASVANFTIASTPRTFNRQSNEWEDGQALFIRCSAWRDMAEHCAGSLSKGMRVIAHGSLSQRSYQANDGTQRTVVEMTVDEIGPSLRYATAQVQRAGQQSGFNPQGFTQQGGFNPQPQQPQPVQPQQPQPAQPQPAQPQQPQRFGQQPADPWAQGQYDEPVF